MHILWTFLFISWILCYYFIHSCICYFEKLEISLFKENTYLIFAKLQQLKIFSSNLNAQSKKQVIFTSFLLPKKRFFFLVKSQCAILESSIFTIFMYFSFLQKPRTALLEQLSRILPSDSDTLPDQLILANTCDRQVLFSILFIN